MTTLQAVRLLLRAALALPMIASGIVRLIPVQMPPLRPLDLRRMKMSSPWFHWITDESRYE